MKTINSTLGSGEKCFFPGSTLLVVPEAVFRIWRYREKIEWEARDQFSRLANMLSALEAPINIITLAKNAAHDEKEHAELCRKIVEAGGKTLEPLTPELGINLGGVNLTAEQRALYVSVALSCITETLSTALLVEMQKTAESPIIRTTVHRILEDEITHSRLGWAYLANQANVKDVSWISQAIPLMLRDSVVADVRPMVTHFSTDLTGWGILRRGQAKKIMLQTVNDVILPGLSQFGIKNQNIDRTIADLLP